MPTATKSPTQTDRIAECILQFGKKEGITTKDIVAKTGIPKGNVMAACSRLVQDKIVERPALGVFRPRDGAAKKKVFKMGEVDKAIVEELTKAGRVGLLTAELASRIGAEDKVIKGWWYNTGRNKKIVTKVGAGHYVLTSHVEEGTKVGLPVFPTKELKRIQRDKTETVRWTRAHDEPNSQEEFNRTGMMMVKVDGEMEILARAVASLWWERPFQFDLLGAVQHVLENEELRGTVRYRKIVTLAQIQSNKGGKSLYQMIGDEISSLKKLLEDAGAEVEPVIHRVEVELTPEQALAKLHWSAQLQLLIKLLTEGATPLFELVENLSRFANMKPTQQTHVVTTHTNMTPPAGTTTPEKVRKPIVALLSPVDHRQFSRLQASVEDVMDIEQINIRQGGNITYPARWTGVYADNKQTSLGYFRAQARKIMMGSQRFYQEEHGFHQVEKLIHAHAEELRSKRGV